MTRQRDKLDLALGGIKEMGGRPDMLVVIDTNKEEIAISEAKKLGIPIAAVVDSNSNSLRSNGKVCKFQWRILVHWRRRCVVTLGPRAWRDQV